MQKALCCDCSGVGLHVFRGLKVLEFSHSYGIWKRIRLCVYVCVCVFVKAGVFGCMVVIKLW